MDGGNAPSPLACVIVDGPHEISDAGGEFLLASTRHAIRWRKPPALLIERFGPDHPLNQPFEPTNLVLVMAISSIGKDLRNGGWGVPAYPVAGEATSVVAAQAIRRDGAKVRVVLPTE